MNNALNLKWYLRDKILHDLSLILSPYYLSIKENGNNWYVSINDNICWKEKFKNIKTYADTTLLIIDEHYH